MTLRSHLPSSIRVGGRGRPPRLLQALLALSVALNVYLFLTRGDGTPAGDEETTAAVEGEEATPAGAATAEAVPTAPEAAPSPGPAAEPATPELPTPAGETPARYVRVVIEGAVSRGFVAQLGSPEGDRVALTASRPLVWSLDLTKDPQPGDVFEVLYRPDADEPDAIDVLAVRYVSASFGRTFEGMQFKPEGWPFPGWFDETGSEVAPTLDGGPIREYEQITSLIGDGRGHSGMDFKAKVGTKVYAPFDGTVVRNTWNFKYNGNCIEIRVDKGNLVRFLHMSELDKALVPGSKVTRGQYIGLSGNTGRSSAPHLHYEIVSPSDRVLDPLDFHPLTHRTLSGADKEAFDLARARLIERLEAGHAAASATPAAAETGSAAPTPPAPASGQAG